MVEIVEFIMYRTNKYFRYCFQASQLFMNHSNLLFGVGGKLEG
jgi:hypothetical protein